MGDVSYRGNRVSFIFRHLWSPAPFIALCLRSRTYNVGAVNLGSTDTGGSSQTHPKVVGKINGCKMSILVECMVCKGQ